MPSLILLTVVLATLCLLPRRRDFISRCDELLKRLPQDTIHLIEPYLDCLALGRHDRTFWRESGGLRGQARRLRTAMVLLQLIQIHLQTNRISGSSARYIWRKAFSQCCLTLLSLPESMLHCMIPEIPHAAARLSTRFYRELVLQTDVLCARDGDPQHVHQIRDLV